MPADSKNIDLNRLKIFSEVARSGSFSKAALKLGQPKSKVSRIISALEGELGVQLIFRTTRQFRLTPEGEDLFRETTPLLAEIDRTLDRVTTGSGEVAGPIRLTVPDDIGVELMGAIVTDFMKLHPRVRIDLHVGNAFVDLVKDSFDIALRIGRTGDSTLIQRKIGSVDLVLAMSPAFRARHRIQKFEDLERAPFLAFGSAVQKNQTVRMTNGRETKTLKLKPIFSCNNFFTLRQMALLGAGFTVAPPFVIREYLKQGDLDDGFGEWSGEGTPIRILMPHQTEVPLRIRKFIDFLTTSLAGSLT